MKRTFTHTWNIEKDSKLGLYRFCGTFLCFQNLSVNHIYINQKDFQALEYLCLQHLVKWASPHHLFQKVLVLSKAANLKLASFCTFNYLKLLGYLCFRFFSALSKLILSGKINILSRITTRLFANSALMIFKKAPF